MRTLSSIDNKKLYKAGVSILTPLYIHDVYTSVLSEVSKILNGESGSIFWNDNDELKRLYTSAEGNRITPRKNGYVNYSFEKKRW